MFLYFFSLVGMLWFIRIVEPQRGVFISTVLHDMMNKHSVLASVTPVAADVFVFVYPVYLSILYIQWRYYSRKDYQHASLLLFFSWFGSVFVNFLIKIMFSKQRPVDDWTRDDLVLWIIPQNAFPSDHAAMSSAIAMTTLLLGIHSGHRGMIIRGVWLMLMSLCMSWFRMMAGLHRPTDIIAWSLVGICMSYLLTRNSIYKRLQRCFFVPLISLWNAVIDWCMPHKKT